MSEFKNWAGIPEVSDTMGNGWGVRINGCDVFDSINQHGVKPFRSFDIVRGLETREAAEQFRLEWLRKQLPDTDREAALREELATAKRNEHNSEVAYKAAIEKQEELREDFDIVSEERDRAGRNASAFEERMGNLQVENGELQQRLTAAEQRNVGLQKDKDRLDALESNFWDVRHSSHPIADTGDSSSSLEIIGHWMDKPFERVIGEDYNDNLRAAIDQAMTAPAYPPERPEYPEIDELLEQPTESGASDKCASDGGTCGLGGHCGECPHVESGASE